MGVRRPKIKIGDVFTDLTVVEKLDIRKKKCIVWTCKCFCGNFKQVTTDYLNQGWTKSCGCRKSKRAKERLPEIWKNNPLKNKSALVYKFNTLFQNYKRNATQRKLVFELSEVEVYNLATSPCHYCGYIPQFKEKENNQSKNCQNYSGAYNGIDRKDSRSGYTSLNSLACCKTCNIGKNKMSYGDFIDHLNRLVEFRRNYVNT